MQGREGAQWEHAHSATRIIDVLGVFWSTNLAKQFLTYLFIFLFSFFLHFSFIFTSSFSLSSFPVFQTLDKKGTELACVASGIVMNGVVDLHPIFSRLRRLKNNSARPRVPTAKQAGYNRLLKPYVIGLIDFYRLSVQSTSKKSPSRSSKLRHFKRV